MQQAGRARRVIHRHEGRAPVLEANIRHREAIGKGLLHHETARSSERPRDYIEEPHTIQSIH